MPLVFADQGDVYLLELLRTQLAIATPRLWLYQNDVIPAHDSVIADFLECTFGGYGGNVQLHFDDPAALNLEDKAQINAQLLTYVSDGAGLPQRVYGYYVTNAIADTLLYATRFPTRVIVRRAGQTIAFTPAFSLTSEY